MAVGLTIGSIRTALAAQLKANVTRAEGLTVHAQPKGVETTSPRITIDYAPGDPVDYWQTMGGSGLSALRLELIVEPAASDVETASTRLDQFLSVGTGNGWSVVDAVMRDRTLGLGAGVSASVDSVSIDPNYVARFLVTVHVSKQGAYA